MKITDKHERERAKESNLRISSWQTLIHSAFGDSFSSTIFLSPYTRIISSGSYHLGKILGENNLRRNCDIALGFRVRL